MSTTYDLLSIRLMTAIKLAHLLAFLGSDEPVTCLLTHNEITYSSQSKQQNVPCRTACQSTPRPRRDPPDISAEPYDLRPN